MLTLARVSPRVRWRCEVSIGRRHIRVQPGAAGRMLRFVLVPSGEQVLVSVKPVAISVRAGRDIVLTFDREGRLFSASVAHRAYRRGYDNRVLVRDRRGGTESPFRNLDGAGRERFFREVHQRIAILCAAIEQGAVRFPEGGPPAGEAIRDVREAFAQILAYDPARLEADARRFGSILRPLGMLPPDQALAVVLQAVEGCAWNQCSYYELYRDRPYQVKTAEEFAAHIQDVKAFLGQGLMMRRSVFLGDGNAMSLAHEPLLRVLDLVNQHFWVVGPKPPQPDLPRFMGIYTYMDAFSPLSRTPLEFEELGRRGLRRVYIGADSGHEGLLKFLGKPSYTDRAWRTICALKEGGINVGIILLLGVGGELFYYSHVHETVAFLNSLPLGEKDIIYFSPFIVHAGSAYASRAAGMNMEPLSVARMEAQRQEIVAGLQFTDPRRPPRVAQFDIRGFIY